MAAAAVSRPGAAVSEPAFGVVFDSLSFMIDEARFAPIAKDRGGAAVWRRDGGPFVHPLELVSNVTAVFFLKRPLPHESCAELVFYMQNAEDGAWRHVCRLDNHRPTCAVKLPYVPTLAVEALPIVAPGLRGASAAAPVGGRTPATPEPVVLRPPPSAAGPSAPPAPAYARDPLQPPPPPHHHHHHHHHHAGAYVPGVTHATPVRTAHPAHGAAPPPPPATAPPRAAAGRFGASPAAGAEKARLARTPSVQLRRSNTKAIEDLVFEGKKTGPGGLPTDPAELLQLGAQRLGAFKTALEESVADLQRASTDVASLHDLLQRRWVPLTEEYVTWVQMTLLDPVKAPDLKAERKRLNCVADGVIAFVKAPMMLPTSFYTSALAAPAPQVPRPMAPASTFTARVATSPAARPLMAPSAYEATGRIAIPAKKEEFNAVAFLTDFAIGGVSGAIAKTCTAPIERVKLLIQTQDANPKIISGEVQRYTGIIDCFSRVAKEQGIGSFWRGNLTNVLRYFPTQAFNFAFKDSIKKLFPKYNPNTEFWSFFATNMASGGLAGAGSLCIVYPLDYARTRLASDVGSGKAEFNGLFDCLAKTAAAGGPMALYNGFGVSVIGIIPYRGVYFGLYDTLSSKNPYKKDLGMVGIGSKFAVAQVTAITAGYASYPFDTVRRRLQMQSNKPRSEWIYSGTIDCFTKILSQEGVGAMFKGAGANALRTVGSALVLVLYDQIKGILAAQEAAKGK